MLTLLTVAKASTPSDAVSLKATFPCADLPQHMFIHHVLETDTKALQSAQWPSR